MASLPPSKCCYTGVKHEGTAQGKLISISDISTYVAYPSSGSTERCALILTDVIGHDSINAQLIADEFAANGFFVAMPDLFHGDAIPLNRPAGFDLQKWLHGPPGHLPDTVDPIITSVLSALRDPSGPYKVRRVGAVGYCFGGKYVARFLAEGGGVDCGFAAHPSFMSEEELRGVRGPFAIAAAESDEIFTVPLRHRSEEILLELSGERKLDYQIMVYSGVTHGFATRGDPKDPRQKLAKEQAFLQAVAWLDHFM